jgi:hypothetical protein
VPAYDQVNALTITNDLYESNGMRGNAPATPVSTKSILQYMKKDRGKFVEQTFQILILNGSR